MSDIKFSLVSFGNIGDYAYPVNTLIEKISNGVGGAAGAVGAVLEPWHMGRIARAKADAMVTLAKGEQKVKLIEDETATMAEELKQRMAYRFIAEQISQQKNIEDIARKSFPLVTEDAKPEDMENDWVTNFFAKARYISDEDMQKIWAGLLAGEANNPGSFSKQTVNLLNDLDKRDVELFETLCRFGWYIDGEFTVIIFNPYDGFYSANGVFFAALEHLDSLGLVQQLTGEDNYGKVLLSEHAEVNYFGNRLSLKTSDGELITGKTTLTRAGKELARLANPSPVEKFYEYSKRMWSSHGHTTVREL